ncbi:S8 family serine peptidase [Thalassotalea piscium]|uniref:Subtilisin family serine protease/subtilisin-like proprotein convertase family protein n=1 Tax=Thalassotalea piscium TaxID=1230533 RepID=A0A7X0NKA6_9GAMM|nr:S8 family serine peptidase [Thalassotalea piscium]MBB6544961.1 subtilisin family serine protease/subtilisin-like proprotein convertase family protein [Thalassotalea piscium]
MKSKLSALTLAMLPALAMASTEIAVADEKVSYESDSIIVVYKEGTSALQRRSARSLVLAKITDLNSDEIDDAYRNISQGRMANYKLSGISAKEALKKLNNHPAVLYAEPDYIVKANVMPNDARFDELWGMHNTGQTGGTADADIDAPEAWEISTGSSNVVVGVIDSGVDHTHPDLIDNAWVNTGEIPGDGIDNDGNGYIDDMHGINAITNVGDPMDDNGHGTHVAGTIGGTGNNAEGVVGVNHDVSIVGCKFLDAEGSGATSNALKCMDYMVSLKNNGVNVRVLNNSWGGGGSSQSMIDAINASEAADILFVAAAGNATIDNDVQPHYPSNYDHESVLSVASTTHTDSISYFSHWGLNSVDMGAPGSSILSTVPGGGYESFSGTSMATPHVAGAAALALSVNPELNVFELKELLMTSGDDNADLIGKTVSGKRLNVHNALVDADPTPGFGFSVTPSSVMLTAGDTATYSFDVSSIANWSDNVALTVTDSLGSAFLSTATVSPGNSFTLTVPTTANTTWGDYEFTVTGTSGELVKSKTVSLYVNPQGLNDFTYNNTTPVDIPDNDDNGITSIINIADDLTVFGSSTFLDITHTYIGDLVVKLTSPSGTTAILHNHDGGSTDNIAKSFASDAFNGESTLGDWTLSVEDSYASDSGTLNNWSITFSALGEVGPAAPIADFTYDANYLSVAFTDNSSDVNDDIVSWAWDFGDGASSTEQNPFHSYAATGAYSVSLTVTDSEGHTSTTSANVNVSDVSIEAALKRAYKSRLGKLRVDITWSGTGSQTVDIYRNGEKIDTVANVGIYRDRERRVSGSQFIYKVCDESGACSNDVTVNF